MAEKRNFTLLEVGGSSEIHTFTGTAPRQAALKAATRGYTKIALLENGTNKVHLFCGSRERKNAAPDAPKWIGKKVYVGKVEKQGIKHFDGNKTELRLDPSDIMKEFKCRPKTRS